MQSSSSTALNTFARSLRPRAQLFARMQMGDKGMARLAEEAAWQQFARLAPDLPLAQWPLTFWSCLLKNQELANCEDNTLLPTALQNLPAESRAAWLLKHIANLNTAHAAHCMHVSETRYLEALIDAEQRLRGAGYDGEKMQRLRKQWLDSLHNPESSEMVNAEKETTESETVAEPTPIQNIQPITNNKSSGIGRKIFLLIGGLACIGLLAWAGLSAWKDLNPPAPVKPPPPPVPASEAAITVMHPDYMLLVAADDEPMFAQLDRLSWWLVKQIPEPEQNIAAQPGNTEAPADFTTLPVGEQQLLASIASAWNVLDSQQRRLLHRNAQHWLGLNAEQRDVLNTLRKSWDNSPINQRMERKQRFAIWEIIPDTEQRSLRTAYTAWQKLPAVEQAAVQTEFNTLTPEQREAWWLGPSLGSQLEGLRPLFDFTPLADRPALLAKLRQQTPEQRAALIVQITNGSSRQREELRRQLLQSTQQSDGAN